MLAWFHNEESGKNISTLATTISMDFGPLQSRLKRSRVAALDAFNHTRALFEEEIALKYDHRIFIPFTHQCSQSKSVNGDAWIPTYPPLDIGEGRDVQSTSIEQSVNDVKGFWNRNAETYEEKVFRGKSPLRLLKPRSQNIDDLGSTTVAVPSANIDGEPLSVIEIPRSVLPTPGKPPIGTNTPQNRWRENLKSPPQATVAAVSSVVATPSRPPVHPVVHADYGATIPILPSNANAAWPPKSPPVDSTYQTPKPATNAAALDRRPPISNYPPSAFVPRYTPAPGPLEIVHETLVPVPSPPLPEDQYEMTAWEDSDAELDEDEKERRRLNKRVPAWCIGWIETAKTHTMIDPDTVFGSKIPKCDLEVLFGRNNNAYLKARKGKRGSSGEWGMDDVTRRELEEYRQVMGHTQQLDSVVILRSVEQVVDIS